MKKLLTEVAVFVNWYSPQARRKAAVKTERRLGARYIKRIPMQVAIAKRNLSQNHSTATMNISRSGLYFATDLPLREGTELELRLKVPEEIKSLPPIECKFIARVAHVERMGNNGMSGVGVHFLYYSVDQDSSPNSHRECQA